MAEYKIKFVDKVLDNVHGFIGLTKLESKICDLPVFRRLIHIKQLGLANWVFPGAEHTRYIHSLGVMHIIDQMAIKLHYDDTESRTALLRTEISKPASI
jgi:HD superfamily phosphohydrolase